MSDLPPVLLPLAIKVRGESIVVVDRGGTVLSHSYFEDEPGRRRLMHRVSRDEAVAIAKIIARAVTDRVEAEAYRSKTAPG